MNEPEITETKHYKKAMPKEQMIETLVAYLKLKVEQRDWHGVSDAANDIRVLEGK